MIKTSGSDKFALHDFLMSYASFLHKRFHRIQDFLQLPVDETARAFSFLFLILKDIILLSMKIPFSRSQRKELIKNVLLIAEKTEKLKQYESSFSL